MSGTTQELIEMARAAQHDERLSDGALYGKLADRLLECADALRQWKWAEEHSDEQELGNARSSRDAAIAGTDTDKRAQMDHPDAYRFLRNLADWGGCADRHNLGPQLSQSENSARQYCKRHGWAKYEGGYWRITDSGCVQINWTRPKS